MREEFGDREFHYFTCLLLASSHATGNVPSDYQGEIWEKEVDISESTRGTTIHRKMGTVFCFLLLTPSPSRPGWYERLDSARVTFFSNNLDVNFAKLEAQRATLFLS